MDGQIKQTTTTVSSVAGTGITTTTNDYTYVVKKAKEISLEVALQYVDSTHGQSLTPNEFISFTKQIYTWLTTE